MANSELLEQIAQDVIYPQRYNMKFKSWSSERHHAICLREAEKFLEDNPTYERLADDTPLEVQEEVEVVDIDSITHDEDGQIIPEEVKTIAKRRKGVIKK